MNGVYFVLYVGDMEICGESEEDLRVIIIGSVEVFKRKDLKINADESKVVVLGGDGGWAYDVSVEKR